MAVIGHGSKIMRVEQNHLKLHLSGSKAELISQNGLG